MSSKVRSYPGTEITAAEARAGRYLVTKYATELKYSWSSGEAISQVLGRPKGRRALGAEVRRLREDDGPATDVLRTLLPSAPMSG